MADNTPETSKHSVSSKLSIVDNTPETSKHSVSSRQSMNERIADFHARRHEDLRSGEAWSQQLQNPSQRSNPDVCEQFWAEIKGRVMRRYGSIELAFKKNDTSCDGFISFLEFVDFLRILHLPLKMQTARAVFERASGGDRKLSVEELRSLLMERTIRKLKNAMRGFNRKQERIREHVHQFMKELAHGSSETLVQSVDRLQRKLSISFCRELWKMLIEQVTKNQCDGDLERSKFFKVMTSAVGSRFMSVEVTFFMRIFDRIDRRQTGRINVQELLTALVLVSDKAIVEEKLGFLFEVFDSDSDGCLLYDEILALVRCICSQRPVVEDAPGTFADASKSDFVEFHDELTAQDGLRLYECLLWYLQRTAKIDCSIVSWSELWEAFKQQPEIINAMMPGHFRMNWVLQPSLAEEQPCKIGMQDVSPGERLNLPQASENNGAGIGVLGRRMAISSPGNHDHRHHEHQHNLPAKRSISGPIHESTHSGDCRTALKSVAWESRDSASPFRRVIIHDTPHSGDARSASKNVAWDSRDASFKHVVKNRFLSSLRNLGIVRHAELQDGFKHSEELGLTKCEPLSVQDVDSPTSAGRTALPQPSVGTSSSACADEARPSSVVGVQGSSPEPARPGSSPGVGRMLSVTRASTPGKSVKSLARVSSAPTGHLEKPNRTSPTNKGGIGALGTCAVQQPLSLGKRNSRDSVGGEWRAPCAAELPTIDSQRWGLEAADRFQLFSFVRNGGRGNPRHVKGCCGHTDLVGYKCQLCRSQHTMLTSF